VAVTHKLIRASLSRESRSSTIRTGLLLGTDAHSTPTLASSRTLRFAGDRAICGNRRDDKTSHVARYRLSGGNAETDEWNPKAKVDDPMVVIGS